jgi:hypothetical protein
LLLLLLLLLHGVLLLLGIELSESQTTMSHLDRNERIHTLARSLVGRGILGEMMIVIMSLRHLRLRRLLLRHIHPSIVKRRGDVVGGKGNDSVVMKRMKIAVVEFRGTNETKINTVVVDDMRKWITVPDIGRRRGDAIAGVRSVAVIGIVETARIAVAVAAMNEVSGGRGTDTVAAEEGDRARTVIATESHVF